MDGGIKSWGGGEARKENSTCKKKEEYLQDTYTFSIRY